MMRRANELTTAMSLCSGCSPRVARISKTRAHQVLQRGLPDHEEQAGQVQGGHQI